MALQTLGNPEDAADALQDGLLNAMRRAAGFRGEAAVTTWLHRVVVNACLDRVRREGSRPRALLDPEVAQAVADPRDAISDGARAIDVQQALSALPPEQQAALVLVDLQGFSVQDAATILECPPGTVKSRCARGRAALRPMLAAYGPAQASDGPRARNRSAASDVEGEEGPSPQPERRNR